MLFLHAGVHRAAYRQFAAAADALRAIPLEPITVTCPGCGDRYVATFALDEEPFDLEALEWEAGCVLETECPDHWHYFEVGGEAPERP